MWKGLMKMQGGEGIDACLVSCLIGMLVERTCEGLWAIPCFLVPYWCRDKLGCTIRYVGVWICQRVGRTSSRFHQWHLTEYHTLLRNTKVVLENAPIPVEMFPLLQDTYCPYQRVLRSNGVVGFFPLSRHDRNSERYLGGGGRLKLLPSEAHLDCTSATVSMNQASIGFCSLSIVANQRGYAS